MRKFEFTTEATPAPAPIGLGGSTSGRKTSGRMLRALGLFCLLLLANFENKLFAQCSLVCNDDLNVSLPGPSEDCELTIDISMVLEGQQYCNGPFEVSILTAQGLEIPTSPIVNASHIGQTFIYSVEETSSGNSCWGTISIEDKLGPQITGCNDIMLPCLSNYLPTVAGGHAPTPSVSDCSDVANFSYTDIITHGTCNTPGYVALVQRTWTATDENGYSSSCSQFVTVKRVSLTDYTPVCPANVDYECTAAAPNTSPAATGYPYINVSGVNYPVIPGANNFCEIAASYVDEVFTICGGGKKILRTWTIYDWCLPTTNGSGNPWSCIQVIKIHDTTAPVVTCPAPIVQGSASGGCSASLTLPAANVFDACSSTTVKVLTPQGIVNGNGGLLLNVPVGTHTITYVATDACGNVGTCATTVTVNDVTPPVAICDDHTTVSLTADGTAIVAATVFDDGSTDNCNIQNFQVRRMASACQGATLFSDHVTFNCCDVGQNIMVAMRVYDYNGNSNECMVEVEVQDKIAPTIVCPTNKTIECSDPAPAVTPPSVNDNCSATWTHTESSSINNCGTGFIYRNYTATDPSGYTATCTQTITVVNSTPFNIGNIIWPYDYTTDQCGPDLEPTDLPLGYDFPTISEDDCDLVAVAHTDQPLFTNAPACFKILRKWIVIDWCQYNPNVPNSPGYWEHTQVIKVEDNVAPVVTCPTNITVSSLDANCGTGAVTVPDLIIEDCSNNFKYTTTIDYASNGSIDFAGNNPGLSGNYPFGTHAVTVKVEDLCGNATNCAFSLTVVDGKKPTPVCVNGLAVELMSMNGGGMVQLTPQMFNQGSFDNCTPSQNLTFSISPSLFTCDNVGTNIVTMWVTDQAGNSDYCETYVIIQDNMVICPDPLMADISGGIADETGSGMGGVAINVSGNGPLTAPATTTQNGQFLFSDLNLSYDYTLTPAYNLSPLNGVTTYDLVLITRHILNIQLLDSPYKMIAADVNKSGSVTTGDVVELRKMVLQINTSFPNNTSWRFVDKDHVFPNPSNPFTPAFPEFFNVNDLATDQNGVDFVAVKVGDVNGSASTNFTGASDERTAGEPVTFKLDDASMEAGKTYQVDFRASNFSDLIGYQFALRFDPRLLELAGIEEGALANLTEANFGLAMLEDGLITTSWDHSAKGRYDENTVLFSLVFKAKGAGQLSEALQLAEAAMPAEAYRSEGGGQMELRSVGLQFGNTSTAAQGFELYQNKPNPFDSETLIGFHLPAAGKATLTVFDLAGKVLATVTGEYEQGYHEVRLGKNELGASGVLFYQLETAGQMATRRMVRL